MQNIHYINNAKHSLKNNATFTMQNIHYINNAKHSLIIHKIEFTNA